jgi:hypothetical protein
MEISFFALPVILAGLFISSSEKAILAFLICFVFGGTATISLSALGGAPILPAVLFFPFLMWKALNDNSSQSGLRQLTYPNPGFWLMILVIYEVFSAYAFPRLFAGEILVYVFDRSAFSSIELLPLKPVSTNLTQSFYSIFGFLTYFAISQLVNSRERLIAFRNSVLIIASINVLAALIQMGESYLGFPPILAEIRNANYAMFNNDEVSGLVRIQGTFPEASAYSAFTLPLFAFTFSLYRNNSVPFYSGWLSLIILCLLMLSTSTTTYFSLLLYIMCNLLLFIGQALSKGSQIKLGKITGVIWFFMVLICILLLVNEEISTRVVDFFNLTLFNKLDSSSGRERSAWNWQGISNLLDTYGIGIGFASNRSSNFFVALLSNVGILGASLFAAFVWKTILAPKGEPSSQENHIFTAAKNALLISSFSLFASSAFADPGMFFYVFAAVAAAGSNLNSNLKFKKESNPILSSIQFDNPGFKS